MKISKMNSKINRAEGRIKIFAIVLILGLSAGKVSAGSLYNEEVTCDSCMSVCGARMESSEKPTKSYKMTFIKAKDNYTTAVLEADSVSNHKNVTDATFTNDDRTYRAISIHKEVDDDITTIIINFPYTEQCNQPSMTIMVDGEEVPIDIDAYLESQRQPTGPATLFGITGSFTGIGMPIYINDEPATLEQVKNLTPDQIDTLTTTPEKDTFLIYLRK